MPSMKYSFVSVTWQSILNCEQAYFRMLACKLLVVAGSLVIPAQIALLFCRLVIYCIQHLFQFHSLSTVHQSLWTVKSIVVKCVCSLS